MFLLWDANNASTEDEVIAGISDDDDGDGDTDEASTVRYTTEEEYDK